MQIQPCALTGADRQQEICHRERLHAAFARLIVVPVAVLLLGLPMTGVADEPDPDKWQFTLTPYLWLPTIGGDLRYELPPGSGGAPVFDVGPTDWLDLLNYALLVGGSAKKGRFSVMSDFVYLEMSNEPDTRLASVETSISGPGGRIEIPVGAEVTLDSETELTGYTWSIALGYELHGTERSVIDGFIGARYFDVDVETRWSLTGAIITPGGTEVFPADGQIGGDTELWDAIIGVRGRFALGDSRWSVPYYADIGSGSSDLTWNAYLGLTYGFKWGDLLFAYRHLQYEEGESDLLGNFSFSGPAIGASFRF